MLKRSGNPDSSVLKRSGNPDSSGLNTNKSSFSTWKKFILIFLIILCARVALFAPLLIPSTRDCLSQTPTEEWVARYPGPSNDLFGPFLQVDKSGNSYIAGTKVINDSINILCVKYNTLGVQQWAALYKYPGYIDLEPTGLALDSTGNAYVITGIAQSFSSPLNSLIVKFNSSNGSPVWVKTYFGQYIESAFFDIKIDKLNNIYVVGAADTSHLVIRYNTNGDSVWVRKYRPPYAREVARACTIDDSLNIIFTGQRIHTFDSLLVAKYSSGGILRWESTCLFGVNENVGTDITADQNGNLYIGGVTVISGFANYLTLKYDRNGVQQWAKIYDAPGSGNNEIRGVAINRIINALFVTGTNGLRMATTIKYNTVNGDSVWVKTDVGIYNGGAARGISIDTMGNVYITGETYNFPSYVPFDILTVKYSSLGNKIWQITYNGPFNDMDIGRELGLDSQNNVYVLGTSPSSTQITDYVIIKYNQLLGIKSITNIIPKSFKLEQNYPNPFNPSTKIRFSIPKNSIIQLKIFDVLGRIKEISINERLNPSEYEFTFNAFNYPSGVYFYQLIADNYIIDTKKLVLIK